MIKHASITATQLRSLFRSGEMTLAGNQRLKIYGTFFCSSGKKMKRENRIFFADETEALAAGYRPCAHCMKERYRVWKKTV